ncbi:DMT family transporter [Paracoccus marinus]|uniref:DMT family transporter n=1 Tax=Paracoccus marinus TaxID=288426 RepID=UPI00103D3ECC|nr:DMT family transporter [Paracoccus marinus]GLS79683.1 transporter RarD family, DMT superfamily protein [Paracoccus marinus]
MTTPDDLRPDDLRPADLPRAAPSALPFQNPLKGITLKLGSVTVFTVMGAILKATADEVPVGEQVFFRSFFAIPVILVWLASRGELGTGLRTHRPMSHFYRGIIGTMAMVCGFAGLGLLPLPEQTALGYAMPLLTVLFAGMFLGEEIRGFRISMVLLGIVGVLIVLSPRLGSGGADVSTRETLGAVVTLAGAALGALAQIFIRRMVTQERTSAIVFWFSVTSTVLALVSLPFGWVWPSPATAALLVATGTLGGIGQIMLTSSYRYADASLVAPFDYASMVLALLIGWFVFGEVATTTMLAGAAVIIAAGIAIIWRERQLGIARSRSRKAMTPQG